MAEERREDGDSVDWDLFSTPARYVNRAQRLLARLGDSRLRAFGFGVGQLPVLIALKNGVARSQKELAQIAQVEQPTMAQILARMERDEIIQRVSDPSDRRSSLVTLTEATQAKLPPSREALLQGHREALAGFRPDEIETLTGLLQRVIDNLESAVKGVTAAEEPK